MRELKEQVSLLADDKTQLMLQNQELHASYRHLAAHLPRMRREHQTLMLENYRLQSELQNLRKWLGQDLQVDVM